MSRFNDDQTKLFRELSGAASGQHDGLNGSLSSAGADGNFISSVITGDDNANFILGTASFDTIQGLGGNDTIFGGGGNDVVDGGTGADSLYGGGGNDTLNGGAGNDFMDGSAEGDRYVVNSADDVVKDTGLEPGFLERDIVDTTVSFTLSNDSGIEVLQTVDVEGIQAINLTGANAAETIYGNSGDNLLKGLDGDDHIYGNSGNDILQGGQGADYLFGDYGANTLTGGTGKDLFGFVKFMVTDAAKITDFVASEDKIAFYANPNVAPTQLGANQFHLGTQARDADDRIIYDKTTGQVFFDVDGRGGAAQLEFAVLTNKAALSASDFLVQI